MVGRRCNNLRAEVWSHNMSLQSQSMQLADLKCHSTSFCLINSLITRTSVYELRWFNAYALIFHI